MRTSRELAAWIAQGERGSAADTIVEHLTGIVVCTADSFGTYPRTSTELWQCLLLLEAVPTLRTRLCELRRLGPEWSVIVEHWYELEALIMEESALAHCHEALMPKTYSRLARCLAQAADQWNAMSA